MRGQSLSVAAITGGTSQWNDGAAATPSISFASETNMGFYRPTAAQLGFSTNGTERMRFFANNLWITSDTGAISTGASQDTTLSRGSAGVWKFASANSFSANGSVATSVTSLGPAGSHTTIQEWLTIQNASGTVRYIPCY
jgi:hypothetical protein